MSRILITGGAGFIGSNLAAVFVDRGEDVVVFDNFSSGLRSNLHDVQNRLEIVESSICDTSALKAAMEGVSYVFHQAAIPSVPRSVDQPVASHDVNSTGTLNVLMAAREAGVKRVVYAASSSAYGDSETLPKIETMPTAPKSPYAADKLHSEHLCRVFFENYGLETVALRYFNVFGPRQRPDSDYAAAIPKFIVRLLANESPTVFGDGLQSRDFTYIDNVVHANLLAMTAERAAGEVLNVGVGEQINLNELIQSIRELTDSDAAIEYAPERVGDVKHSLASIDKARDLLGFEPVVGLSEGLRQTIDWYRTQQQEVTEKKA